jgi:hypothetical protein
MLSTWVRQLNPPSILATVNTAIDTGFWAEPSGVRQMFRVLPVLAFLCINTSDVSSEKIGEPA